MSKLAQPHFSYDYSRFSACRSKEQTARVAVWRDLGSKDCNIFTMEASFCGPKPVKFEPHRKKQTFTSELNYHFTTSDYCDVGKSLCRTLTLYKEAEDDTMGLSNMEYAVEQYHLDKDHKLQQEELFKQQMALIEQRKAAEALKKPGSSMETNEPAKNSTESAVKKKRTLRKKDTDMNLDEVEKPPEPVVKDEESDALSDSEPSDDNLDEDQILKLIPKKLKQRKYLKGLEVEKQKTIKK